MTSFDVTFAILASFSLIAWNACYINSYLFLTIVGCEKSELLVILRIWRHYDVFMTSFLPCWRHFFIILWHFTTKILKPSIIIAWKWLIPLFNIFLGWQIRIFSYFFTLTSFLRHYDVIWRHFCHLASFFDKLKFMLHQKLMPLFTTCWVWKIRLFNNY